MTRRTRLWGCATLVLLLAPLAGWAWEAWHAPPRPPTLADAVEPPWDGPATRDLAARACFACHARMSPRAWYARVPPLAWWLSARRRKALAAFAFDPAAGGVGRGIDAAAAIADRTMPPATFSWLEPAARLDAEERAQLAAGLLRTLGGIVQQEVAPPPAAGSVVPPGRMAPVPGGGHPAPVPPAP